MTTAIVTGSGGLIGSEAVAHLVKIGFDVVGVDNDMRATFFGPDASTASSTRRLLDAYPEFESQSLDIRDREGVETLVSRRAKDLDSSSATTFDAPYTSPGRSGRSSWIRTAGPPSGALRDSP